LGFFDPLGIMDGASQDKFDQWRHIEIKHGRVAMLAVVGYLTTASGYRFQGAEDIPGGWAAFGALSSTAEGKNVLAQMVAFFLLAEIWNHDKTGKADFLGDYRNGIHDFGWEKQSSEWKARKRAIELNQGRAAQMGILSLMVHDALGNVKSILPLAP
jgi:Chlorophyll A-B binding protein